MSHARSKTLLLMIYQLYLYVIIDNFDFDKQRYDNNPNYTIFVSGLLRGNKDNMDEGLKYFTSYQIGNILKSFEDTTL
jgi:hypothetical protein